MKAQQKLEFLRQQRALYLEGAYKGLGTRPKVRVQAINTQNSAHYTAGFISALFGCLFMLAVFSTFDFKPALNLFYSAWHDAQNNFLSTLHSNITG